MHRAQPLFPSHSSASSALGQVDKSGFDLGEQAGRDEAVAENSPPPWQRLNPGTRPFVHIMLRHDYPASRIIQPERLPNAPWYFDAGRVAARRCV